MNWEAIGTIGELLGFIILIASIFYLSMQIRSNMDQATASPTSSPTIATLENLRSELRA